MATRSFSQFTLRRTWFCTLAILMPMLVGCGADGYPTDLRYPPRTDPIVVGTPDDANLRHAVGPGKLTQHLDSLEEKGAKVFDPAEYPKQDRKDLDLLLLQTFGTPAKPRVSFYPAHEGYKTYYAAFEGLDLREKTLANGSVLYRRHCLHCHGLSGDGQGPTGPWVSPPPRDYRQGTFKFLSTAVVYNDGSGERKLDNRKPSRDDLVRTIRMGVHGTSMPAFGLLEEEELYALASYVIHLSVRGELEYSMIRNKLESQVYGALDDLEGFFDEQFVQVMNSWKLSNEYAIAQIENQLPSYIDKPDSSEFQAAVERGYKEFTNNVGAASCITCHLDFGRQTNYRYDAWGTLVRPADLTKGVYRGGRRPIDLFWRIRGGIPASGMPNVAPFTPPPEGEAVPADAFTDTKVWDIVTFLKALPHPELLPEKIRNEIYPKLLGDKQLASK